MLNTLVKAKLMHMDEYQAKTVQTMRSQYSPPKEIKDDPVILDLAAEYDRIEKAFQLDTRSILRRTVKRQLHLHCNTIPCLTINMIHTLCLQ